MSLIDGETIINNSLMVHIIYFVLPNSKLCSKTVLDTIACESNSIISHDIGVMCRNYWYNF